MVKPYIKDPDATLDYLWDWSHWLTDSDTIVSADVTAQSGITVDQTTFSPSQVVAWISGGAVGIQYSATCRVTTNNGRIDDRTIQILVKQR